MWNIFKALEKVIGEHESRNETCGEYILRFDKELVNLIMFAYKCKSQGAAVGDMFDTVKSKIITKIACFDNYMFSIC